MPLSKLDNLAEEYSELTIANNIVRTDGRTIAVDRIATVSVMRHDPYGRVKAYAGFIGLVLFVSSLNALGYMFRGFEPAVAAGLLGFVLMLAYFVPTNRHYLIISTDDGVRTLFKNASPSMLREARSLLDARLESAAAIGTYTINFDTGRIMRSDTDAAEHAPRPNRNPVVPADPPPAPSRANGAKTVDFEPVDFAPFLPFVEEWRAYLADASPNMIIDSRLDELLELMQAGAPRRDDKGRLHNLTRELAGYMQAYPGFIELVDDISRQTG